MPTQAGDILTVTEVQNAAVEHSDLPTDNPSQQVEEAIRDAQGAITEYLGMDPIVHKRKERISAHEWREDETAQKDANRYIAWARHQPIVEVASPSDVGIFFDAQRFNHGRREPVRVKYFAGYKRRDQTSGEQQNRLSGLTTAPPNLPRDIRRSALMLTFFELNRQQHGPGVGQVVQAVGFGQQTTVEGVDTGFVKRQLRRIATHQVSEF